MGSTFRGVGEVTRASSATCKAIRQRCLTSSTREEGIHLLPDLGRRAEDSVDVPIHHLVHPRRRPAPTARCPLAVRPSAPLTGMLHLPPAYRRQCASRRGLTLGRGAGRGQRWYGMRILVALRLAGHYPLPKISAGSLHAESTVSAHASPGADAGPGISRGHVEPRTQRSAPRPHTNGRSPRRTVPRGRPCGRAARGACRPVVLSGDAHRRAARLIRG